jgi:peptidoglycan-associated lipoprotein
MGVNLRKTAFFLVLTALALTAACNRAPPPVAATPQPTAAELAQQRRAQDSVDAVRRATADSAERARVAALAARARADSVERVRLAAAATAREAAARQDATLREELGVMVHFDVARAELRSDGRATLDRKVAILKANPDVRVRITGACDDRGSEAYNQALGDRRAAAVMRYLVAQGVDAARLEAVSVGETSPIDVGSGEIAWARNRRAEFLVVSGDSPLAMK